MTSLITFEQAAAQLKLDEAAEADEEVYREMLDATGIIIDYLKKPAHGWTTVTVPASVRASILLVLTDLHEHRAPSEGPDLYITKTVKNLLYRQRDPAIA